MTDLPAADLPATLLPGMRAAWERLCDAAGPTRVQQWRARLDARPALAAELALLLACSEYVADQCIRQPEWLDELLEGDALERLMHPGDYAGQLALALEGCTDEADLHAMLRRFRNRAMTRIVWRDFTRRAAMVDTTREVTWLAEACIDQALSWVARQTEREWGIPTGAQSGEPVSLMVLGMGKLGAGELNLSSDIDLIFTYAEGGDTRGEARSISNHEFFIKLGQRLIRALDATTADGFVFRVDMRLRPWGDSGALALSFDAMEEYYQNQGRDWERYAMIKARPVAGDRLSGERLLGELRPFTYRRYLDYSAFESLRAMKAMINREVARKGMNEDVKLGRGGIREIEFIVQSFQLIRGGREPELQERALLPTLRLLTERGHLPEDAASELRDAYIFLRNTEHALQGLRDQQTQQLPRGDLERQKVALVMGYGDWAAFSAALAEHRIRVERHFANVVSVPGETASRQDTRWAALWEDDTGTAALEEAGFTPADDAQRLLRALRGGPSVRVMQALGRERLDRFMPLLLARCARAGDPVNALARVLPLVEAVVRRTAYLVLLEENPGALDQLVTLCEASPWIANLLATHPSLLDGLINTGTLYTPPTRSMLESDLRAQTLRIPADDLEQQMEALRYFRLSHVLRVAASEVAGVLPLMKVSDYLSFIAETVLEYVLRLAWEHLTARHGVPLRADGSRMDTGFIIVGYGKLGGLELGHGSDLDLVFLHDADGNLSTDGDKPLDNQTFYTRLGQRIIHILTTATAMGALYEVDMRLRPSGNSGLLVSSLKGFADYQHERAWTWEHQALVRARPVAGDRELMTRFEAVRAEVLCRARPRDTLRRDVNEMRAKMREHQLPADIKSGKSTAFPLKQGVGGIVDIEFMVQYAVLAWSQQHPALTRWTDNIRILETLEQTGLIPSAKPLIAAYLAYREQQHRLALQALPGEVSGEQFVAERALVQAQWQAWLGDPAG